ncbi:ketopantoate reductase family protein [Saccharomonospora sp. CUA-673]|uniref:ketopantoate reductase family protein n=1 Tax=Saccharomonospora sp. CUA-673 TaxID=1904969 RepID=UPI0011152353|nr:2-dehydropantoate 2-reductase N-terminal domain-containing protein [Saccharomonospora sp. CUA-673]
MSRTVAVVGMGAVGTALAGALAEAGHDVVACGRRRLERIEVTDDGVTRTYPVRWAAEPADVGPVPLTILATKIHDTAAVADWLAASTAGGGHVVAAQNGVDQRERIGPLVAAEVVPALVYTNVERIGPGAVHTRRSGRDLVVPDGEHVAEAVACWRARTWLWSVRPTSARPRGARCSPTCRRTRSRRSPDVASRC